MWQKFFYPYFANVNMEQPAEQVVEKIEPEFPNHPFYPRNLKVLNEKLRKLLRNIINSILIYCVSCSFLFESYQHLPKKHIQWNIH